MKIEFGEPRRYTLKWGDAIISYKNRLSMSEMSNLIISYCQMYFYTVGEKFIPYTKYNLIGAEINLMAGVLSLITDIDVTDEESNILLDIDALVESELYDEIINKVKNYSYFRGLLDEVVRQKEKEIQEENSLVSSIKSAVDSITIFIEKMGSTDITPENLERIKELSQDIIKSVDASSIANVLEDKGRKTRKKG